jgi:transcription-repair coupling factor (superfamily II helicase)
MSELPDRQLVTSPSTSESLASRWGALKDVLATLDKGVPSVQATALWGSSRALLVAALGRATRRTTLVVTAGEGERHRAALDLQFLLSALSVDGGAAPDQNSAGPRVLEFPSAELSSWRGGRHREPDAERALCCHRLLSGEPVPIVATPAALSGPLLTPAEFRARTGRLALGESLPREDLLVLLDWAGYERVDTVVEVGQWSLRGGIVDIFSPAHAGPVRAEFVGDEVESLRLFDPTSQRSHAPVAALDVLPLLVKGVETAMLDAYLSADTLVALEDPSLLEAPPDDAPATVPLSTLLGAYQQLEMALVPRGAPGLPRVDMGTRSIGGVRGQFKALAQEIRDWREGGFTVRLVVDDERQVDRLRQMLSEHDLVDAHDASLLSSHALGVLVGECSGGFELPALGLVVVSENEIFGAQRRRLRRPLFRRGAAISAFTDLAADDLVVHEDHGIARYHGLRTLSSGGRDADFLLLEYAEGGRLYLPVERLDLITKYMGAPSGTARLDRLGGGAWQRLKESVRAALRVMAEQLLRLYAARSVAERPAFVPDTPWQTEFEAAFRFEETPDQMRAIDDVKADMSSPRPMDRLVAGDVGYGKTEVALRAAFKAVADGRQVAVLVPTTVLAQQHFNTFSERFAPFPTRVELLSRFKSPKEQKEVVAGLAHGAVDVVIGTHRLLGKDVNFKNLGLLVVDEEHRFGVTHKEQIKKLRTSVDVLTLTATPIPRTLHMSLAGVRDLSVIETPPLDRLPVETIVTGWNRAVIKEAIDRELGRGGQVFFVHNRVQSLPSMTTFVQGLCPDARVAMAHGQMSERELEAAMVKFVDGQIDVLVSTAIVESGLDIPASNTIIINRADRFGLAQLYQLRGRVGRERQQAYAYLLIPADGRLDETAQRRLRVIEEVTELGAGFRLAMRDLEIRGAGNLLGAAQHGHIAAVGFDLYTKLLADAVRELKGEPASARVDPVISVEVEALLPEAYVPEVNQRLALYQRVAELDDATEIAQVQAELTDRFGPPPAAVLALLDVVGLRVAARSVGVEKIDARGGRATLTFAPSTPVTPEHILKVIAQSRGKMALRKEYTLDVRIPAEPWPAVRDALSAVLGSLK